MAELSALLEKEASAEIEAIAAEAKGRAAELLAAAKTEADGLVAVRERGAKTQREANLIRARSAAQLEASSLRLRAQHDGVQAAFEAARTELAALVAEPARFAPVLDALLKQALAGAAGHQVEAVVVAPGDRELAERLVSAAGVKARIETADTVKGGVRIRTANRSVIENTLFGRLDALSGELAAEVSKSLFGPQPG